MDDNGLIEGYAAARDQICKNVFSAIGDLTKSFDKFANDAAGSPSKFVGTYNDRMQLKFGAAGSSYTSSLAGFDQMERLHGFLAGMFREREPDSLRIANMGFDASLAERIVEVGSRISLINREIKAFRKVFAGNIAQEEASPRYKADTEVIKEVENDFYNAAMGQWSGEYISTGSNGTARKTETQSSAAVRQIGEAYRSKSMKFLQEFLSL